MLSEEFSIIKNTLDQLTVLYVEDDASVREHTGKFLSHIFKTVICVTNGQEGLDAFKRSTSTNAIDLIITDIKMPILDGLKMIAQIRQNQEEIPVIIISAYNDSDILLTSINMRIDAFLKKPLDSDELMKSLITISKRKAFLK